MRPHGKPYGSTKLSAVARCDLGFSRRDAGEMYRLVKEAYERWRKGMQLRRN